MYYGEWDIKPSKMPSITSGRNHGPASFHHLAMKAPLIHAIILSFHEPCMVMHTPETCIQLPIRIGGIHISTSS